MIASGVDQICLVQFLALPLSTNLSEIPDLIKLQTWSQTLRLYEQQTTTAISIAGQTMTYSSKTPLIF